MKKPQKRAGQKSQASGFAIGRAGFEKISAVEGIHLTDAMKKRADDKRIKGLTAENIVGRSYAAIARPERPACMMR
jgi:hypothetical protein